MVELLTEAREGAQALVKTCASLISGERALVLSDPTTEEVGRIVAEEAEEIASEVKHLRLSVSKIHGAEPPDEIADEMLRSDVIFCLPARSLAHTSARKNATDKGARFLSLPDYSLDALASPALRVDYEAQTLLCEQIAEIFDRGNDVRITSESGTDARLKISGRKANSCPGICTEPGCFASPPDIETHIPPLEEFSEGIVVVDGSIPCPEIGVLTNPVILTIEGGRIRRFEGEEAPVLAEIFRSQNSDRAYVIAELGVGLNPAAHLSGRMLEDEGCIGTIHLGCGSNSTFGGNNRINFHLDMVIKDITLIVDETEVIAGGRLCL